MFLPGKIFSYDQKGLTAFDKSFLENYYTCEIHLNVGTITCARESFGDCLDQLDICLNQTMSLDYRNDAYFLSVNGPNGGVYYEVKTDLTKDEYDQLIAFLKTTL